MESWSNNHIEIIKIQGIKCTLESSARGYYICRIPILDEGGYGEISAEDREIHRQRFDNCKWREKHD